MDDLKLDIRNLEVNSKERGIARSRHFPFSRYCYWFLSRYEKGNEFFVTRELSKWAKISPSAAHNFCEDLVALNYLGIKRTGQYKYYFLILNSKKPKLYELLPFIEKTLKNNIPK